MDINNPALNATLNDGSKVDDSLSQTNTTVNLGSGATYNQNCGNQREISRMASMVTMMVVSLICDAIICAVLWFAYSNTLKRIEAMDVGANEIHASLAAETKRAIKSADDTHREMMKDAKEGSIWLLRNDIIQTIEIHEARKTITPKQYRRLKDEYEYYAKIGGNHDVKDRFDDFTAKIYGTGEVKMEAMK